MWCFITLRVKRPEFLATEEREHTALCPLRPEESKRR